MTLPCFNFYMYMYMWGCVWQPKLNEDDDDDEHTFHRPSVVQGWRSRQRRGGYDVNQCDERRRRQRWDRGEHQTLAASRLLRVCRPSTRPADRCRLSGTTSAYICSPHRMQLNHWRLNYPIGLIGLSYGLEQRLVIWGAKDFFFKIAKLRSDKLVWTKV